LEPREEALALGRPASRRRVFPVMAPFDQRACPVEQVADVGQDLARRARLRRGAELGEPFRRVAYRLAAAVGDGGQAMAKEGALHLLVVAVAAVVHVSLLWDGTVYPPRERRRRDGCAGANGG